MTTPTLETYTLQSTLDAPVASGASDMIVRGIKVFRVGSFRDSRGRRNDWTAARLQRAVDNFNALRRRRILPDVPVRLDHTTSIQNVVGYFHELDFDGTFLRADVLFTKKDAYEDYQGGHLRNVSLEIGQYRTNDEDVYDDVVQGLAFVDIPAVEGLHQRQPGDTDMATQTDDKVTTPPAATTTVPVATDPPPATEPPATQPPATEPPASQPPATEPTSQHRGGLAVHTFRVNGGDITDFGAVQNHINVLEKFRTDTRTAMRASFVEDLFTAGKIVAGQKDAMSLHVASLDDEQFATFRTMYDATPASNLFGKHDTTTDPSVAAQNDAADELVLAKEIIAQFRRQGKSDEFIQRQPQWATVQAASAK